MHPEGRWAGSARHQSIKCGPYEKSTVTESQSQSVRSWPLRCPITHSLTHSLASINSITISNKSSSSPTAAPSYLARYLSSLYISTRACSQSNPALSLSNPRHPTFGRSLVATPSYLGPSQTHDEGTFLHCAQRLDARSSRGSSYPVKQRSQVCIQILTIPSEQHRNGTILVCLFAVLTPHRSIMAAGPPPGLGMQHASGQHYHPPLWCKRFAKRSQVASSPSLRCTIRETV